MEVTILYFLDLINNVKIYHWKTRSYAEHIASDTLHGKLSHGMDRFAEVFLGTSNDRFKITATLDISDKTKKGLCDKVKQFITHLEQLRLAKDLSNIREEVIADCKQFLYLMTFDK
jgi:hypothetical protein